MGESVATDSLLSTKASDSTRRRCCALPSFGFSASWRFGLIAGAICSVFVLLLNLSLTIWAVSAHDVRNGQGTVFEGSRSTSKRLDISIHLIINILSTVLLGASNYCMQCLSAPTRQEIDKVHAESTWLDIGVPSYRNLTRISSKRTVLWVCVALSSLPLHLFYNSAFYASWAANEYQGFIVRDAISELDTPNNSAAKALFDMAQKNQLEELNQAKCINSYGQTFQASHGNLLLVVSKSNTDRNDILDYIDLKIRPGCDKSGWVCGQNLTFNDGSSCGSCTRQDIDDTKSRSAWVVRGFVIDHCLSQRTEDKCKIHFSVPIASVVIIVNAFKVFLFGFIAMKMREAPLMTVGDAIASFMQKVDHTTEGMCLMSRAEFENEEELWQRGTGPRFFYSEPKRWSKAASKKRWVSVILLYATALAICLFFAFMGLSDFPAAIGTVSLSSLSQNSDGIVGNALRANVSQAIFSFIYVTFNALLTALLLSKEWNQYGSHRKGLRVTSKPRGAQRSTYFLQLPYRYGIPLLAVSGTFHWLLSQTIYLISVEVYQPSENISFQYSQDQTTVHTFGVDRVPEQDILTTGFSSTGLWVIVPLAFLSFFALFCLGRRRFGPGIPVASSCSAAISAACHVIDMEPKDAVEKRLQWGVTIEPSNGRGVGHCSFSSLEVGRPIAHCVYAGRC